MWYSYAKKSHIEVLKENKIPLTEEERQEVMDAKAIWHHGPNGEASPAVWKAKINDKITYISNTHRVYQEAKTLKGIIKLYHSVVKETA